MDSKNTVGAQGRGKHHNHLTPPTMRKFETGAIRSPNTGKIEYYGFRHPIVELSFGRYMQKHQKQEDGAMRTSSNWWGGWDTEVSLQSMLRHMEDLTALEAGYRVFKVRTLDGERTEYATSDIVVPDGWVEHDAIETANAIKFNANAYILQAIKNKCPKTNFPPPPNTKSA